MLAVDMGDRFGERGFARWMDKYRMRGSTDIVHGIIKSSEQKGCCAIA
jgi:hypothetical protein